MDQFFFNTRASLNESPSNKEIMHFFLKELLPPSLESNESRKESVSDLTTPAISLRGVRGGFLSSVEGGRSPPASPPLAGLTLSQPRAVTTVGDVDLKIFFKLESFAHFNVPKN